MPWNIKCVDICLFYESLYIADTLGASAVTIYRMLTYIEDFRSSPTKLFVPERQLLWPRVANRNSFANTPSVRLSSARKIYIQTDSFQECLQTISSHIHNYIKIF